MDERSNMSNQSLITILRSYHRAGKRSVMRRRYLRSFHPMMVYRTTKTERPTTTRKTVGRVLARLH